MALSTKGILFPSGDGDGSIYKALQLDPTSSIPARILLFEETSSSPPAAISPKLVLPLEGIRKQ
jgi:hypothetical protein